MKCCGTTIADLEEYRLKEVNQDKESGGGSEQVIKLSRPGDKDDKGARAEIERKMLLWSTRKLKPSEVSLHNRESDCWLSWNGVVRDLTPVLSEFAGSEAASVILAEAGKDVTHWFDKMGNLRGRVSHLSGTRVPYLPRGAMPQTYVEVYPSGLHPNFPGTPWWQRDEYIVGYLTSNTRQIAITNTLAVTTANITVCEEDSLELILMRYLMFNENASNYTWKYDGRKLNMKATLEENGIPDIARLFRKLGLPEDTYTPNIFLYYNDKI